MHAFDTHTHTQIRTFVFMCKLWGLRSQFVWAGRMCSDNQQRTRYIYIYSCIYSSTSHIAIRYKSSICVRYCLRIHEKKIKYGQERSIHHRYSICQASNLFLFSFFCCSDPKIEYIRQHHSYRNVQQSDRCLGNCICTITFVCTT